MPARLHPPPRRLDRERRRLLEHLARDQASRPVAFRIEADPAAGGHALVCLVEYFAGAEFPAGPWHLAPLELARDRDRGQLCALAKRLAAEFDASLQD